MKAIASRLGLVATLATVALIFAGAVEENDRTASAREVEQLRGLVNSLEKKVGILESRIKQMESRSYLPQLLPGNHLSPIPGQPGFVVPVPKQATKKTWGKGEFNGWPYYIVPLQEP